MNLKTIAYPKKSTTLPATGRNILAWYDERNILVFIPHIGEYYGDKTVSRPIWITPSFSWMMHHADWLESVHYETIECMMIERMAFEELLLQAFPADYSTDEYASEEAFKADKAHAVVHYRWQTDYSPDGQELDREILLLGIHSRTWMQYVIKNQIKKYNEIDEALFKQKDRAQPPYELLIVPDDDVYPVEDAIKKILNM